MNKTLKNIILIIVIVVILALIGVGIYLFVQNKIKDKMIQDNKVLIEQTNIYLKQRDEYIKEIESILKVKSDKLKEIDLAKLTVKEKDTIIIKQNEIIQEDTKIINDLKDQLEKANKLLSKKNKRFGIEGYIMGGLDKKLEPEIFVGIDGKFYMLNGFVNVSIGAYVKIYENQGGGGKLSLGFNF